jgi:translocator protein
MVAPLNPRYWRYLALLSLLLNIVVNVSYEQFTNNISIAMVSSWYKSLFTPAAFTFGIWILIYLLFIIYALVQLLPSQRFVPVFDYLSKPFILANLAAAGWVLAYTANLIFASVLMIAIVLFAATWLFKKTESCIRKEQASRWMIFPFSIFLGWMIVATISNIQILPFGWFHWGGKAAESAKVLLQYFY